MKYLSFITYLFFKCPFYVVNSLGKFWRVLIVYWICSLWLLFVYIFPVSIDSNSFIQVLKFYAAYKFCWKLVCFFSINIVETWGLNMLIVRFSLLSLNVNDFSKVEFLFRRLSLTIPYLEDDISLISMFIMNWIVLISTSYIECVLSILFSRTLFPW